MTIDEAIALVKIENECINRAENCNRKCNECELVQNTDTLLDLYKHLAEWLEELKKRRSEDYGYLADIHQDIGYRKAIDDFVKEICKMIVQSENNGNHRFYAVEIKQAIADLAEQLKAGVED